VEERYSSGAAAVIIPSSSDEKEHAREAGDRGEISRSHAFSPPETQIDQPER